MICCLYLYRVNKLGPTYKCSPQIVLLYIESQLAQDFFPPIWDEWELKYHHRLCNEHFVLGKPSRDPITMSTMYLLYSMMAKGG